MRSEAMAWLFSLGGIETDVLEGGYKSYRHHILNSLVREEKNDCSGWHDRKQQDSYSQVSERTRTAGYRS